MSNVPASKNLVINSSFQSSNGDSGFIEESINDSLVLTNEQERQALKDLNNRFAKYVEHIRQKDTTESAMKSIEELSDIPSIQLENLRQLFCDEIKSLRDALDQQSNDGAKMLIANNKLEAEKKKLQSDLRDKSEIINQLTNSLSVSRTENETMRTKIVLFENFKKEAFDLTLQLKECQKQLEMEVLLRTSADNACLTYKEKMEFNEAVFKKELGALLMTNKNTIRKLTSLQTNLCSSNILEQMEVARKRLKDFLHELRLSIDDDFLKRIESASSIARSSLDKHRNVFRDNELLSHNNHDLLTELAKLKASHVRLEDQLSDLESLHQEEINRLYQTISDVSSSQIDELGDRMKSLQDLSQSMTDKGQLDAEISFYRKMIESEEDRTSYHSKGAKSPDAKKRKMNNVGHSQNAPPKTAEQPTGRPILRGTRRNKSCSIM